MSQVINLRDKNDRNTRLNVLGEHLAECSCDPMTGWKRDGSCTTGDDDQGLHVVCCLVTDKFLEFSKAQGNDLSTPRPEFGFPGLKEGNQWCLCAARWAEALKADCAPPVDLSATHQSALSVISLADLKAHALDSGFTH